MACYPARFQLVLAANPCPCAPPNPVDCVCSAQARLRYRGKLSGPLVDRVDLRVALHPVSAGAFVPEAGEHSAAVRQRVTAARLAAQDRWRPHGIRTNAEVDGPLLRRNFRLPKATMEPLRTALERGVITMRGADRCLRVAWTLADLAGRTSPALSDVTTAFSFRQAGGVS